MGVGDGGAVAMRNMKMAIVTMTMVKLPMMEMMVFIKTMVMVKMTVLMTASIQRKAMTYIP